MRVLPEVAVIIPTFNRPAFLQCAVASLLVQTYADWCAVIISGSAQPEAEFTDTRIKWISESDFGINGLAQARNLGVSLSDSRYIAYLDDDELYYPSKLEVMMNFMRYEANSDFAYHDIVVTVVEWTDNGLRQICVPRPHWHPPGNPNKAIRKIPFIAGLQAVHSRRIFEAAGGFRGDAERGIFQGRYRRASNRFDEDADLFKRIAQISKIERVPLQLAEYRVHGGNVNAWGIDYHEVLESHRLPKTCY